MNDGFFDPCLSSYEEWDPIEMLTTPKGAVLAGDWLAEQSRNGGTYLMALTPEDKVLVTLTFARCTYATRKIGVCCYLGSEARPTTFSCFFRPIPGHSSVTLMTRFYGIETYFSILKAATAIREEGGYVYRVLTLADINGHGKKELAQHNLTLVARVTLRPSRPYNGGVERNEDISTPVYNC